MSKYLFGVVAAGVVVGISSPSRASSTCDFRSPTIGNDAALTSAVVNESDSKKRAAAIQQLKQFWDKRGAVLHAVGVKQAERVSISLRNPPGARLRVSFDSSDGTHHELEWDPAVAGELTRVVALEGPISPATERVWNISMSVEASTYTQAAGTVIVNTRFSPFQYLTAAPAGARSPAAVSVGIYSALAAALGTSAIPEGKDLEGWPAPTLAFSCEAPQGRMDEERFADTGPTQQSGLRGFGVAPTFVTDTLSLLTEIAVDRAKAGAMNLLKKRLVNPFCVDKTKITLDKLGLGKSDGNVALPRTCEILTSLRLEDILSSGRPLLFALRDDLRFTIAPAAVDKLADKNATAKAALGVGLSVINTAIDHGGFDGLEGQLALGLLGNIEQLGPSFSDAVVTKIRVRIKKVIDAHAADAKDALAALEAAGSVKVVNLPVPPVAKAAVLDISGDTIPKCSTDDECARVLEAYLSGWAGKSSGQWRLAESSLLDLVKGTLISELQTNARSKDLLGYACEARLVVALVKRCTKQGCSAQTITDMISRPADYFAKDVALPAALCWHGGAYFAPVDRTSSVSQLVLEGMRLAAPLVDGRGRDRAKAAVKLLVTLVQRWQTNEEQKRQLATFAELAIALIDEDYGTALGRLVRIAQQLNSSVPDPLKKIAQLVGSVATYAQVYQATKDSDPKEARTARKQALTSIIDNATDRSDREQEWVYSIGSNVGLAATWSSKYDALTDVAFDPGVRVPLGFAIEYLPKKDSPFGAHFGFQVADLGQFVRHGTNDELDSVRWADFVSPGAEFSLLLNFIDPAVNVTVHAEYAPSLQFSTDTKDMMDNTVTTTSDGVWRYGISLGYYVPFFDLK